MICSKCKHQEKWSSIWPKLPMECKKCNRGEDKERIHPPQLFGVKEYKNNFKLK